MSASQELPLEYEEVAPDATSMIESMRAYGYSLPAAIADLIDNSITARASEVDLHFRWNGRASWIAVTDNGCGMDETALRQAMRLGSRNPLHAREPSDLGRFGMGLKSASFSQCRRLTVASRSEGTGRSVRRWDLDYLARPGVSGWHLLKQPHEASAEGLRQLPDDRSGTVVLWEQLDRLVDAASAEDEQAHDRFLRRIEEVEEHLAMVFHRFLSGPGRRLRIWINGRDVTAWDPFLESEPSTEPTEGEAISVAGFSEPVLLKGFILPHRDRLGGQAHRSASGPKGWNAQQGFYVYRNRRLIVAGDWLGLGGGSRPWMQEEHYKLARIRVEIPNSMDHLWQLDVKKSTARPPEVLRPRLQGLGQTVRQRAREVFSHRGSYGSRQRRPEMRRPWKPARRNGNVVGYRVDRSHPLVAALCKDVPPELRELIDQVLRVLEETIPIQQIWVDSAHNTERNAFHDRPFQGIESRELRRLIQAYYRAFRELKGMGHDEALEAILEQEEFVDDEARAIVASMKGEEDV